MEEEVKETTVEETEISTIETPIEVDPWADWSDVIKEITPQETVIEKAVGLTDVDAKRIVREEIKAYVAGVREGKYPPATQISETSTELFVAEKDLEETKTSFTKQLTEIDTLMKEKVDALSKAINGLTVDKIEVLEKSLKELTTEVGVIRDQPIEIFENAMKNKELPEPRFMISEDDGSVTRK